MLTAELINSDNVRYRNKICWSFQCVCQPETHTVQVAPLSQIGPAMLRVCQSLTSIVQYVERNLLSFTSASHLPLRTITKVCISVLFSSSWSSMLVVINIDSLMRGDLCVKLHGGRSQLLFALYQSSIDQYFCLRHLHSTPPLGGRRRNIAIIFGTENLEWRGYPTVKK